MYELGVLTLWEKDNVRTHGRSGSGKKKNPQGEGRLTGTSDGGEVKANVGSPTYTDQNDSQMKKGEENPG